MSINKEKRINLVTALLRAVADNEQSIAEKISKDYKISKVSVYKYLSSLEEEGIIARIGRGNYEILREDLLYGDTPYLTLVAGVNGSGKSSFSGVMKERDRLLVNIVDVDKITWELSKSNTEKTIPANKVFPTKSENLRGAKKALGLIRGYLDREETFAQETTLAGRSLLNTIKKAKSKGYCIRMFYIGIDGEAECKKRIKNRVKKGGHNIPDADVERRYSTRREALWRVLPLCDEAEFYDNNNGFRKVATFKKCRQQSCNKLDAHNVALPDAQIIPCSEIPRWLKEMI